jgi:hypothetical protein
MAVYNTVHGASGGHWLDTLLEKRLYDSGGATTCAILEQRQVQGHDGPFDVFRSLSRVALGSFGSFLGPGGIVGIVAISPLVEPAFRAGQVPTDVLDLIFGKIFVDGLVTTLYWALGHRCCLYELMLSFSEADVFSMS